MKALPMLGLLTLLLGCDQYATVPEAEPSACNAENPLEMPWLRQLTSLAETDADSTLYLSKIYQYTFQSAYVFHLERMASSFFPEVVNCSGQPINVFDENGEIIHQELLDLVSSRSGKVIWDIDS